MDTPLLIAILFGTGVIIVCAIILLAFCCYRRYKHKGSEQDELEESRSVVDSVTTPNIIMTRKDRTEDLFTGKRMPFGVHSSMTNIPDEVEKEAERDKPFEYGNSLQPNGFRPMHQSPFLSSRQNSTKSNAPSFSEYAEEANSSIQY